MNAKAVVAAFWRTMDSNDFTAVGALLSDDYELHWPQSGERVVGRANFAAVNSNYPAHGAWVFTVNALVAEENEVVSDVGVTDGVVQARAITFSTVRDGRITRQVEFWPDPYTAPGWRSAWVEPLASED